MYLPNHSITRITITLPSDFNRFHLLSKMEKARNYLKLNTNDLAYMRFALTYINDADCQNGNICGFWLSPSKIADALGFTSKQVNRIETKLERLGFITRNPLPNKQRVGGRDDTQILYLAGINLAPLFNQYDKILAAYNMALNSNEDKQSLRTKIVTTIQQIRASGDKISIDAMFNVDRRLRPSEIQSLEKLERILKDLTEILNRIHKTTLSITGRTNEAPRSVKSVRPNTISNSIKKNSSMTPDEFRTLAPDDLAFYLDNSGFENWNLIANVCKQYAPNIGVDTSLWQRICGALGENLACIAMLVVNFNSERPSYDPFKVNNPRNALHGLCKSEIKRHGTILKLLNQIRGSNNVQITF